VMDLDVNISALTIARVAVSLAINLMEPLIASVNILISPHALFLAFLKNANIMFIRCL